MAFGLGKLEVLESKLSIYEDLSKEMLDKLERAVSTISENSNKANQAIIKMINDHQKYDDRMFKNIDEKIGELEKKVEKNNKFVIGATAVIATLVTVLQVAPPIFRLLTPAVNASMMTPGNAREWI
jgi:hypothetical protein